MKEVRQLHVDWRPDIYRPADTVYSKGYFEHLVAEKRLLVVEQNGAVAGLLSFMYRHIEYDKQVTRDAIFVDDLAVKVEYRVREIGTKLLSPMKEKVRDEHLDCLKLQVNARNTDAGKMYEKFEFTEKSINLELCYHFICEIMYQNILFENKAFVFITQKRNCGPFENHEEKQYSDMSLFL